MAEHKVEATGSDKTAQTAEALSSSLTHDEPAKVTGLVDLDRSTEEIEQKTGPEQIGDTKDTDTAPAQPQPFIAEQDEAQSEEQPGENTGDAVSHEQHDQESDY